MLGVDGPWSRVVVSPTPIRPWATMAVESARALDDGRRVLLLRAPRGSQGVELVDEAVERHARARGPTIVPVLAHGASDDERWAVLDAPVVADLADAFTVVATSRHTATWGHALAMKDVVLAAFQPIVDHGVRALHAVGFCNVLVLEDTSLRMLLVSPPPDTPGPTVFRVEAPEWHVQRTVDERALVYLSWALPNPFMRSGGISDPRAREAMLGRGDDDDPYLRTFRDGIARASAVIPSIRLPTLREGQALFQRLEELGSPPADLPGLQALVQAWLAERPARATPGEVVLADTEVRLPDGGRVDLRRHPLLRRLLLHLARARVDTPGRAVPPDELLTVGWPDDRVRGTSSANRLWVAISRLRGLGLDPILQRHDAGYRLDPGVSVRIAPPSSGVVPRRDR
jgi:hypothetical protein